jgi:hypothetical protein
MVLENRVLRKTFGSKGDEVTEVRRRLHNVELYALYFSKVSLVRKNHEE